MRIGMLVLVVLLSACGREYGSSAPGVADCLKAANSRVGVVIQMQPECAAVYHPENVPL